VLDFQVEAHFFFVAKATGNINSWRIGNQWLASDPL